MEENKDKNIWKPLNAAPEPSPIPMRECACGCGYSFSPSRKDKIYLNNQHANYGYNHGKRKKNSKKLIELNKLLNRNDRLLEEFHGMQKGNPVSAFLINLKASGFNTTYYLNRTVQEEGEIFYLYRFAYSLYTKNNQTLIKIYKL